MSRLKLFVRCAWLVPALAGCAVGPDFRRPVLEPEAGYLHRPAFAAQGVADASAPRLLAAERAEDRWWMRFRSPPLDDTVERALAGSPTLASAQASLNAARATEAAVGGGRAPQLDLPAGVSRSGGGPGQRGSANLFTVGPLVRYDFDPFGRLSRQVEQQGALVQYQAAQLAAARLALCGNAVGQAVTIAATREQIRAVRDIVALDEHTLSLVRVAEQAGHVAHTDVLSAESQLAGDRTLLPPLEQQLSQARHALTVLTGQSPAAWSPPDFDLDALALPDDLPLMPPSALVRQRPDILAAEAQLHAANAAIGVATADLYPSLTLSASWSRSAATAGGLFGGASPWDIALALTAPLFHGGSLDAARRATVEAYAAQLGLYRQTVLAAFGQVADVLRALEHDVELERAERAALAAAEASFGLMRESFQAGQSNLLQVLDAQRQYQQARLGYARSRGQRYADTVQFFATMGGGAWADAAR